MRRFLLAAILAGFALTGWASQASAAFAVQVFADTGSGYSQVGTTVYDNGAGDTVGVLGVLNASFTTADFTVSVATGSSKPASGSAAYPFLDLSFAVVNITGKDESIRIQLTDTDFTPLVSWGLVANIGGTNPSNTTTTFDAYATSGSGSGSEFDMSGSHDTLGPFSGSSYSSTQGLANPATAPYSLTSAVTVHFSGASQGSVASGDADIRAAPAPAGLALVFSGAPMLGLVRLLRRRLAAAA